MNYYIPQNELNTPQNELTFFISWYVKRLDKSIVRTPFLIGGRALPTGDWIFCQKMRGGPKKGGDSGWG